MVNLCRDCKSSRHHPHNANILMCTNTKVASEHTDALAASKHMPGVFCSIARMGGWFSACGKSGKQWKEKQA